MTLIRRWGGDAFGFFLGCWPGVYLLGTGAGRINTLHASDFDINDVAIEIGSRILVRAAVSLVC